MPADPTSSSQLPPISAPATSGSGYRLSIVMPAFNEEENIVEAMTRATEIADRVCDDHELIIVDDGSVDGTAALVEGFAAGDDRVRLLRHGRNRGYGEALRSGFRAARLDLVFFTDADNQFDLNELERFLPWTQKVDVVAGYRVNRRDPLLRRFYARTWNLIVRSLFYAPVRDIDCAFKVFRRHLFESLDLESVGAMVNTELMVKVGRSGGSVIELGVAHYPRTKGVARGGDLRVILRALWELKGMYHRLQHTNAGSRPLTRADRHEARPGAEALAPRRVVVIGGGIAGCSAALRAARLGHRVTLIERSSQLGGLVVSFAVAGTPLECFYHHIFPHEADVLALVDDLGLTDRLGWYPSSTAVLHEGRIWPFTSPADLLRFAPLPPLDRLRAGIGALRMGRVREWETLDRMPAGMWLRRYCGDAAGRVVWDPLLGAKFGNAAGSVPAAWMWGRINQRLGARRGGSERLGYLRGGFKQLFSALERELTDLGVDILVDTEVKSIDVDDGRVRAVATSEGSLETDFVVFTGALTQLAPLIPAEHRDPRWSAIGALGVLCVVLELRHPVSAIYWTNVCDPALPFGGIIEHTNLVPAGDYGGRSVVYLSRYFTHDEPIAHGDIHAEAARWVDALVEKVDGLSRDDVLAVHPFRTLQAAPLVTVGHLSRIPPLEGDLGGLIVATTGQIYPQDRGMDEGVKAGYRAGDAIGATSGARDGTGGRVADRAGNRLPT